MVRPRSSTCNFYCYCVPFVGSRVQHLRCIGPRAWVSGWRVEGLRRRVERVYMETHGTSKALLMIGVTYTNPFRGIIRK